VKIIIKYINYLFFALLFLSFVSKADAITSLNATIYTGPNPSTVGQQVGIRVVSDPFPTSSFVAAPTGVISFYNNSILIGTEPLAVLGGNNIQLFTTLPYTFLSSGNYSITASYPGDTNYAPFTTPIYLQTVGTTASCPCTSLTTDISANFITTAANMNSIIYGETNSLFASVAVPAGITSPIAIIPGSLTENVDNNPITQIPLTPNPQFPNGTFVISPLPPLPVGQHTLSASYPGDNTFINYTFQPSSSTPITFTINPALSLTTFSAGVNGQIMNLFATINPAGIFPSNPNPVSFCSTASPTGSVNVMDGTSIISTIQVSSTSFHLPGETCYFANTQLVNIPLSAGTHNISVVYSGDGNFESNTSQTQQITVQGTPISLNVPQNITTNATGPSGANVTYVVTSSGGSGTVTVNCSPVSGSVFPIGTTTVSCNATDGIGDQASGNFDVTVVGATGQLQGLLNSVTNVGPGNSFTSQVINVQQFLQATPPNFSGACSALGAFINHVNAQSGKSITTNQAASFVQQAQQIQIVLGC